MAAATSGTAKVTLPADDQILIEREFAAPAHLVWRAVTEPELVRQWWHAGRGAMTTCEIDLRVGGAWRYAMRPAGGEEFAFYGEFLELVPDEKVVQTETSSRSPTIRRLNTMTLTERDGVTLLRTLVHHDSQESRDMHINSGMEAGMQDAFDRLERIAIALA